jgi:hypothetical protein
MARTVVIGVDGSEPSLRAADWPITWAAHSSSFRDKRTTPLSTKEAI